MRTTTNQPVPLLSGELKCGGELGFDSESVWYIYL